MMANNKLDDTSRFGAEVLLDGLWGRRQTFSKEDDDQGYVVMGHDIERILP